MRQIDNTLVRVVPPVLVIALLIARLVAGRRQTESAIFPTPLAGRRPARWSWPRTARLWEHIGASLMRVGDRLRPGGRWSPSRSACGWAGCAARYDTLNPLFQMLRPISPIAWIPIAILWFGVGNVSPIFLIFISSVFPMIVQTTVGRAHDRAALPARRGELRRVALRSCSGRW